MPATSPRLPIGGRTDEVLLQTGRGKLDAGVRRAGGCSVVWVRWHGCCRAWGRRVLPGGLPSPPRPVTAPLRVRVDQFALQGASMRSPPRRGQLGLLGARRRRLLFSPYCGLKPSIPQLGEIFSVLAIPWAMLAHTQQSGNT